MRHYAWSAILALIIAWGVYIRVPELDKRPMHGDEANQAVRTGILLEKGKYHYDPTDHHGPVLYFATLPFCRVTSTTFAATTEWNYRLVPVCFFALTLLLTVALGERGNLGLFPNRGGLLATLLFTAVSPAMAYYSRFYIQETLLITFQTGMLLCVVRYAQVCASGREVDRRNRVIWSLGFGAFAGLAIATKETFVLTCVAGALAFVAGCGWRRLRLCWSTRDLLLAIGTTAVVALLFFSSFLTYPRGVYDALFSTVQAYLARATNVPEHQNPWNFYLKILFWFKYGRSPIWSEAAILLPAAVAMAGAFWRRVPEREVCQNWLRFLTVYTLALTLIYSVIPYKTPWCALSFLHGFILLAGAGVGILWEVANRLMIWGRLLMRSATVLLVAAIVWQGWVQLQRACFTMPADPRNPYVYAHTGMDAMNMLAAIEKAAQKAQGYDTLIAFAVPTPDTWPLPWYLRKYRNVGYWTSVAAIPQGLDPIIVVAAADQGDVADERFGKGKQASFFGIRPGVLVNLFLPK